MTTLFQNVLILFLSLTLSIPGMAKCPDDIQEIKQGQTANCDGLLFSPEASKKVDENLEDLEYYKGLSEKLQIRQKYTDQEIEVLDKRLKNYIDQSQILSEQLTQKENSGKWEKVLYFGLGVLGTGFAFYGVSKLK